jgi:hypothetical protein
MDDASRFAYNFLERKFKKMGGEARSERQCQSGESTNHGS